VIGIAVGTVLVPEMTHRLASGDEAGAQATQNRAIEFALLLALPCVAAFLVVPGLIMRALFVRGAFTAADAHAAALTLMAYTVGLIPFILIRSVVAPFFARGDTATPVKAALIGTAVNIVCKVALMFPLAQVGLALATSIGAWLNFILVLYFAARARLIAPDTELKMTLIKLAAATIVLALVLALAAPVVTAMLSSWPRFRDESALAILVGVGAVVYGGLVVALLGRRWLSLLRGTAPLHATPSLTSGVDQA
jgi:putative peptidoglycan lipid II flippase